MNLQQKIVEEMKVKTNFDAQLEFTAIITFIKDYCQRYPFIKSLVLGISGGQDSTLTGKLCQMAVNELKEEGRDIQFIAVRLPYGVQKDEQDCQDALQFIQPDKTYTINIKKAVDASIQTLTDAGVTLSDFHKGNEKARERMKAQYAIAAYHQGIVVGTDHSAESITGFYTKYGDGGADIVPIFGLNKRQGRAILKLLGAPSHLYEKTPTADLEENKPQLPDEVALGVTYDEIDDYLEGKSIAPASKEKLEQHYLKTQHKRLLPISRFNFDELI